MYDELGAAIRETRRLEKQAHSTRQALRVLEDTRRLGEYRLTAGGELDEHEILDFLRLAIGSTRKEVQITVTALVEGTDQGRPQ